MWSADPIFSTTMQHGSPSTDEETSYHHNNIDVDTPDTERTSISESSDGIHKLEQRSQSPPQLDSSNAKSRNGKASRHRRSHIKSKKGCFSCKDRRVKCDEHQPSCKNCLRRDIVCIYPPPPAAPEIVFTQPFVPDRNKSSRKDYSRPSLTITQKTAKAKPKPIKEEPEFEGNTLQLINVDTIPAQVKRPDLELMQNFITDANQSIVLGTDSDLWRKGMVGLGVKHDYLMHALLMFSAGHLASKDPSESSHTFHELHHRQQALVALRETLTSTRITMKNFDAVLGASFLLALHSCATFEETNLDFGTDGYIPLMNGVRMIGKEMWRQRDESMFSELINAPLARPEDTPLFGLQEVFQESSTPDPLKRASPVPWVEPEPYLPGRVNLDDYVFDSATLYRKVLALLTPLLQGVLCPQEYLTPNQRGLLVCGLLAWPAMLPNKFVSLLKKNDRKAMLIMAYYYACLHQMNFSRFWWMKNRPQAMCRAICRLLGDEYGPWLVWPAQVVDYPLILDAMETWQPDVGAAYLVI